MKKIIVAMGLLWPVSVVACQKGYVPTETPGVCVEANQTVTNPAWVSDEKPPTNKMPSYEREGVKLANPPAMAEEDSKADKEKTKATLQGKRSAGIE